MELAAEVGPVELEARPHDGTSVDPEQLYADLAKPSPKGPLETPEQLYDRLLREMWGRNIASARERCRMTQLELATKTGLSQSSIAKYETGDSKPTPRRQESIARELRRNPANLFPLPAYAKLLSAAREQHARQPR